MQFLWNLDLKPSQNNRIKCVLIEFIVIPIAEQNNRAKLSSNYISHSRSST